MVPARNKAKCLSSINHTTKATPPHHHQHHHHHVKEDHNRYLQVDNCAKEWQLNQVKLREIKDNSYKLFKTPTVKTRSIATFHFSNLGSRAAQHTGKYCRTVTTPRGVLLIRVDLSNLV